VFRIFLNILQGWGEGVAGAADACRPPTTAKPTQNCFPWTLNIYQQTVHHTVSQIST